MTIHYISDDAVERIGKGLIDATLPRVEWTHAAHFAAALWLLRHRPDAVETLPSLIRRYNEVAGDGNSETSGYHETITQASLRAARHVLLSHDGLPLHEVLDHLMASPSGRSDWLLAYWSRDRLFSVEARRVWCEPDLQPLPF